VVLSCVDEMSADTIGAGLRHGLQQAPDKQLITDGSNTGGLDLLKNVSAHLNTREHGLRLTP
jgi:hypothetical protein